MITLPSGTIVPWNAAWLGEVEYRIQPCRWAQGRPAVCQPHRPGTGKPLFAEPHTVRQRMSIARMICTVCGKPCPPEDRWWFALGQFDVVPGFFVTQEAPVHKACGELAEKVCPHLMKLKPNFTPMPKCPVTMFSVVGGQKVKEDFGLDCAGRTVVGALKLGWKILGINPNGSFALREW